jgi:prevent-host-death family protein
MQPKSVGIREAKIQLSKLLKLVKEGNEVILTDRGNPVGKIVPIESQNLPLEARIKRLENQGMIEPLSEKDLKKVPLPIPVPGNLAQRFLREDRNGDD